MDFMKLNIQLFADGKVVIETDLNDEGFKNGLNKMQSIAKTGFKAIATSVGVVTTALAGMVAAGVKSFADLEQNIGGIETLFKDSADTVIKNAERAYKTAGLSANKYMETVTSFSARLLQGLGGDTEEAARIADIAIIDMSDNANKMGTSMEMITNAYQGFAKQNYTMLDNLKLGYGGTATEMARLINESGVLGKNMKVTAETVNNVSFDKMIEAIHVVQEEMGITGTTSLEAAETITGSMNAAKAAWDNFLNGSGDIEEFVDIGLIAIQNLSNAVIELAPNIVNGLIEVVNIVIQELPKLFEKVAPTLVQGATALIMTLLNTSIEMLPQLFEMGIQLLVEIINGISEALPELIPVIVEAVVLIVETLVENIDLIIEAGIMLIVALIEGLLKPENMIRIAAAAVKLILALIEGFFSMLTSIKKAPQKIIDEAIKGFREGVDDFKDTGKELMNGLWQGIQNRWNSLKNKVSDFGEGIVNKFKSVFGIKSPSRVMRDEVGKYLAQGIGVGMEDELGSVYDDMQRAIDLETDKMSANVQASGTYQMAMAGVPTFNLIDNTNNTTQLVVNGKVLAEVVNTENRNREVATA